MILFKEYFKEKILTGHKWQTRRLWDRPRAKEGSEQLFYLRPPMTGERPFARARITRVWQERLGEMTEADAKAEGSESVEDFLRIFRQINEKKIKGNIKDLQVYALEFSVVEKLV